MQELQQIQDIQDSMSGYATQFGYVDTYGKSVGDLKKRDNLKKWLSGTDFPDEILDRDDVSVDVQYCQKSIDEFGGTYHYKVYVKQDSKKIAVFDMIASGYLVNEDNPNSNIEFGEIKFDDPKVI